MQELYEKSGWNKSAFNQFSKHDFEEYYPKEFQERIDLALRSGKSDRPEKKKKLLEDVKLWITEDEPRAKSEFAKSAAEVISVLKGIEKSLNKN